MHTKSFETHSICRRPAVQLFTCTQPAFHTEMQTKSTDRHSICRGPTAYLHPATVSRRCTRNSLTRTRLQRSSFLPAPSQCFTQMQTKSPDRHSICRCPAVYLHPASVSHRRTRSLVTSTHLQVQLFTFTLPAFHVDAHETR